MRRNQPLRQLQGLLRADLDGDVVAASAHNEIQELVRHAREEDSSRPIAR
jgi:hypothetical protein